jgi:hypothetical protein
LRQFLEEFCLWQNSRSKIIMDPGLNPQSGFTFCLIMDLGMDYHGSMLELAKRICDPIPCEKTPSLAGVNVISMDAD